jgi:hypothetical protein
MTEGALRQPIFVVGMPRSGTTIFFEALARHPDLAWLSNYCGAYPRAPWLNVLRRLLDNDTLRLHGHKQQYGSVHKLNPWLPQPDEAYEFWDTYSGVSFSRDALHGQRCSPQACLALRAAIARVVAWQHRRRFAAKLTGPPRIGYLRSVFPDAFFVHLIRDARAVVHSLLNVAFWRAKGGLERPFWSGLLGPDEVQAWQEHRDAAVLAALQWKRVIELARLEAGALESDAYLEVRYEDFTAAPHDVLGAVLSACRLPDDRCVHDAIDAGAALSDMNVKFRTGLSAEVLESVTSSVLPMLHDLGYET